MTGGLRRAQLWWGTGEIPVDWSACAVTIGVFDGVHRGHVRLIDRAREVARKAGMPLVLVTFDPHPARVLGFARDTSALSTVGRRAELTGRLGVDAVCVLPFTEELARQPAETFARQVLVDALHAVAVVVGSNFTFGYRGAGTVATLEELGARYGFSAHGVSLLRAEEATCSSSYIRSCLRRGDVRSAARVLGRPHRIDGHRGDDGSFLVAEGAAIPAAGRYTAQLRAGQLDEVVITEDRRIWLRSGGPDGPLSLDFLYAQPDRAGTAPDRA